MIKIYAPASIGNINVGFDVLGAAVAPIDGSLFGDCVSISFADTLSIINTGQFSTKLPNDITKNIVYKSWKSFCKEIGKSIPMKIILEKNMPIESGLGSSACSIVASLMAMNLLIGQPLDCNKLLLLMGKLEGENSGSIHYDNVAPCLLGGIQLILKTECTISQKIPEFNEWYWIIIYPGGSKVSTAKARKILPRQYPIEDCINHSRLVSGFIHASHTNQPVLAAKLMQDIIAEPYRVKLLSGFFEVKKSILDIGAISFGISGSGPALFAVCDKIKTATKIVDWLNQFFLQNSEGFVKVCNVDTLGARKLG